ncbi:DUF445 domain-containing protein [Halalkalibacter sp. AB-rgal2]|uniref:DUF445 domain-containing protein n=1 Tax=Halalkalibacter sp. AB-rgal2 TaxID=3242695 RepID=UPI00359EA2A8
MGVFGLIVFMVIIGAIIGGLTNSLAIKMLFRPYTEKWIGRFRVPFTPGVIPKRRHELASQLGKMVVHYLITAEGISKRLMSTTFTDGLTNWLQKEAEKFMNSEQTGEHFLKHQLGLASAYQRLNTQVGKLVEGSYRSYFAKNRYQKLDELLPLSMMEKIETNIPTVTDYLLERGEMYLQSSEGKDQLSVMIDRFLVQKGKIGNMISMFLGNDRLVDKIQPALVKGLQDDETKKVIQRLLHQEWNKWKQKELHELESYLNEEEIVSYVQQAIEKNLPIFHWMKSPIKEWSNQYESTVMDVVIPRAVTVLIGLIASRLEILLEQVHLDDIVKEQVEAFSVERLEDLVLSISRREFKMITYLGAFLGGFIGLLQGFLLFFVR